PSVAPLGEKFITLENKKKAEKIAEENITRQIASQKSRLQEQEESKTEKAILNIILRADVAGSEEALNKMISNLNFEKVSAKILKTGVGDIDESDIKFAKASGAIICGFKTKIPSAIQMQAENSKIKIISADIIYNLIDTLKEEMKKLLKPEIERTLIGKLNVLQVFKQLANGDQIIGGKVTSGIAKKGAVTDVIKDGQKIGKGRLTRLQQEKAEASEVSQGKECGILFTPLEPKDTRIQSGFILEFYEEKPLPVELK
ncbi:MAG: Translation initiation factor IF-2, partial [Parcubacteria group bacterium GW2011_GWC2_36_17]